MDHTRTMITFRAGNIRFTYRVGGIILHNGRVLCQQGIDGSEQFWFVPGGRAELRESGLPLNELEQFPLYPTFFQKALRSLPEYIMHIVHSGK